VCVCVYTGRCAHGASVRAYRSVFEQIVLALRMDTCRCCCHSFHCALEGVSSHSTGVCVCVMDFNISLWGIYGQFRQLFFSLNILPSYEQHAISRQLCTRDREGSEVLWLRAKCVAINKKLEVHIRGAGAHVDAPVSEL